jgi:hypothetical protein
LTWAKVNSFSLVFTNRVREYGLHVVKNFGLVGISRGMTTGKRGECPQGGFGKAIKTGILNMVKKYDHKDWVKAKLNEFCDP